MHRILVRAQFHRREIGEVAELLEIFHNLFKKKKFEKEKGLKFHFIAPVYLYDFLVYIYLKLCVRLLFDFFQMLREPYPRGIIKYRSPITPLIMLPLKEKCQSYKGQECWKEVLFG